MGIWRFAGAFAVVERQGECGSKTAEMHVSQPMRIGGCYAVVVCCLSVVFNFTFPLSCHSECLLFQLHQLTICRFEKLLLEQE